MNKTELEVVLLRKSMSALELSEKIGINRVTLYRKLNNGKFERAEIVKIRDALGLSDDDMLRIFFSTDGCGDATDKEATG